jgi:hypothetical protein
MWINQDGKVQEAVSIFRQYPNNSIKLEMVSNIFIYLFIILNMIPNILFAKLDT